MNTIKNIKTTMVLCLLKYAISTFIKQHFFTP
nr:MAG TPA: hypothetical protein [Crassvirales sp.]